MNTQQVKAILVVLNNMKTCIVNKDTYIPGVGDCDNKDDNYRAPFNLSKSFSIDWHVYAHTSGSLGIDIDILKPVYIELGYKSADYPVESTVAGDEAWEKYYDKYDLYFRDNEYSKERANLIDKLIEYFNAKLV